jgi:hypothetical protein
MTPPAVTSAGRGKKPPAASERSHGHRRAARPSSTPRRVSGPVGGGGTTRRAPAPRRPTRRVSGPARPRARRSLRPAALPGRLSQFIRTLPDHSLLDQVVRGRVWIPLLGILLAGIVAMQVEVLKLSANTGRSLERGTALQSRNEQLRASVAQLGDDQRIERIAAAMGMVMPPPTAIKFLPHSPAGQLGRALSGIQSPNPTAFASTLAADQAALSVATAALTTSSPTGTATTTPTLAQAAPPTVTTPATSPGVPSSTPSATTTPTTTVPAAVSPAAPTASTPTTYAPTTSATGAAAAGAVAPGAGG